MANRGKGKDRRSVVSRKLYSDGKASGSWAFEDTTATGTVKVWNGEVRKR